MPSTSTYRDIRQSSKLLNVRYDVRGPILEEAQRLEAAGQRIMRLNIGNPAPFGFEAPSEILKDMIANLPEAQGYFGFQRDYTGTSCGIAVLRNRRHHGHS